MPGDALDDLLDYDVDRNDVFRDVDTNMDISKRLSPSARQTESNPGLGIDEELKIAKRRKPIAKLDENRLLSQAGIPKLRRIAKERLRFKGKGHEYSDVARLLNMYQLWLDDLYPRAKFADGLTIIEKLGHTRRMQTMRREWINEGKPQETFDQNLEHSKRDLTLKQDVHEREKGLPKGSITSWNTHNRSVTPSAHRPDDDDLYSATPRKSQHKNHHPQNIVVDESLFLSDDELDKQPLDDDLDALLAEDEGRHEDKIANLNKLPNQQDQDGRFDDSFQDDMEAMAEIDNMW